MDVFIIRHGQSYNNALADMSERVAAPPLTQKGVRQADRVAAHLAGGGHLLESERGNGKPLLDELHCSAMARALETARPIGEAMRLKTQVWVDIHEVGGLFLDHGPGGGGHGADPALLWVPSLRVSRLARRRAVLPPLGAGRQEERAAPV